MNAIKAAIALALVAHSAWVFDTMGFWGMIKFNTVPAFLVGGGFFGWSTNYER